MTTDAPAPAPLPPRKPYLNGVGARLALLMALALFPIGILSMVQTNSLTAAAESRTQLAVMGATMQAAGPQILLIRETQAMARTLAITIGTYVDDPATCMAAVKNVAAAEPQISLVAYVPLSGMMRCASTGEPFDFSDHPLFKKLIAAPEPRIVLNPNGPVSGTAVLGVAHPVFGADGRQIGIVSISLPHRAIAGAQLQGLADYSGVGGIDDPVALITFDDEGQILTASAGTQDAAGRVPGDRSLQSLATGKMATFKADAVTGGPRIFSVVPISDHLFLLGNWQPPATPTLFGLHVAPFALPALMWLSGLGVALLATERLVVRHIRRLARAMQRFAGGNRIPTDLRLAEGPTELRLLGHAYEDMTETILHDEATLENLVRQKDHLLHEVHHRTGNSLQLIASVIRMHLREEHNAESRAVLDSLHDRVMGLATVHLSLYKTAGQPDVQMDEMVSGVVQQMAGLRKTRQGQPVIETKLEPMRLIPDHAVPLSLLLTEVLTSFAPAVPDAEKRRVLIVLAVGNDGMGVLRIIGPDTVTTDAPQHLPGPTVIGTQLVRGFAQQLGGSLQLLRAQDQLEVTVTFPLQDPNPVVTPQSPAPDA